MPEFVWNEYEFIECLGVVPTVEKYESGHHFKIERDGLRLELSVFQYDGDVHLDLYREGTDAPLFKMRLLDCAGARYVSDRNGREVLEVAPAKSFGSRYDGHTPLAYGVRLAVTPHISIELF
ncbi:MAG TPA: hypothetical protein VGW12_09665 [Pyrinomonadaceae bacterium]|nr:hypothetical protein [Pyrinomonadaceae bacterium]